jgi:uncharacterized protein
MRVLRTTDYRRMPWKNGGGETIEMMASPAGASFDTFDWRISMAHVGTPGPFSLFANIDRTLSVIAGGGIALVFDHAESVALERQSEPFSFSGDIKVDSTLIDGPIDDLNMMTRRDRCRHRVARHSLVAPAKLDRQGDIGIVIAIGHSVGIEAGQQTVRLRPKDAIVFDADDARTFTAAPHGAMDLFLIDIWHRS